MLSAFTIVKNFINYGYPLPEAIISILPLVDEFVVLITDSKDGSLKTLEMFRDQYSKIKIFQEDEPSIKGPIYYSYLTNKAKEYCKKDSEYLIYIQADEIFHEETVEYLVHYMLKERAYDLYFFNLTANYYYIDLRLKWRTKIIKNEHQIKSINDAIRFNINGIKLFTPKPVYHFVYAFPLNTYFRLKKHYERFKNLYKYVQSAKERRLDYVYNPLPLRKLTSKEIETIPNIMKGIYGKPKYYVRKELLNLKVE